MIFCFSFLVLRMREDKQESNSGSPSPQPSPSGGEGPGERIGVRIGLNAGEPIEEDGDLFGATVILASRIAVMYMGKIVELGDTDSIVHRPQHEYTQRLVSAVPVPDPAEQRARREARDAIIAQAGVS